VLTKRLSFDYGAFSDMKSSILRFAISCLLITGLHAQTVSKVGVVTKVDSAAKQLTIKTDAGPEITVTMQPTISYRRVPPGETDLKNAAKIELADIAAGDRVLARGKASDDEKSFAANLIVDMSKADIAKKQAAEEADWDKRGVIGIVTAASPEDIAITVNTGGQKKTLVITPAPNALIRRYAPDSIKFEDAKPSTLAEIKTGDQVRALGDKSADGSKLTAQEIVSGSFKEIAATVISVDPATNEMRVTDLATKKPVSVKIVPDSNLRKLPAQMAQMLAARNRPPEDGRGGGRGGDPNAAAGGGRGMGRGPGGGGRGGGDLTKMLDGVPKMTLADLKKGDAIIVLSTVGASADQMTAITMLAGVEPILTRPGTREMQLGDWSLGGLGGGEP
jgi:Cu/Ag efflux protein CusF